MKTRRQSMSQTSMSENISLCNLSHKKLSTSFKPPLNNIAIVVSDHSSISCLGVASSSSIEKNEFLSPIALEEASSNTEAVLAPDTPEGTVYGLEARLLDESVLAAALASGIVSVMETPESIENHISASKCTPLSQLSRRKQTRQTLFQAGLQHGTATFNDSIGDEITLRTSSQDVFLSKPLKRSPLRKFLKPYVGASRENNLFEVGRSRYGNSGSASNINASHGVTSPNGLGGIKRRQNLGKHSAKELTTPANGGSKESSLTDKCNFLQASSNILPDSDEDLSDVELIKSLNGKKCKNILSCVEDSVADTLPVSNSSGTQSKNKRKSLAEVGMRFDANDKEMKVRQRHQITQNCAPKRRKSTIGFGGTNGLSKQMFEFGENDQKSMFRDISSFISPRYKTKKFKSPTHNTYSRPSSKLVDCNKNLDISLYPSLKPSTPKHGINLQTKAVTGPKSRLLKLQTNVTASSSSDCDSVADGQQNVRNSISAIIERLANEGPCNITGAGAEATLSLTGLLGTPTRRLDLSSPAARSRSGSDEDAEQLSDTQPAHSVLLAGVKAFVDVRSNDGSNRSGVVRDRLAALGATVLSKLTNDVTHVVFRDGLKSTFQTSRRRGLFLVSCAWVDECQRAGARLPEKQFPSVSLDKYSDPLFLSRLRKGKSMQPKEFSELEQAAEEKLRRRRLRLAAVAAKGSASPSSGGSPAPGDAGPCSESPGPSRVPPYGEGGSASPSGGYSSDTFEDDLDLGKNINSPLYGIAHLLTPKRDRSPIGSEDTTRENSPQPRLPCDTGTRFPLNNAFKKCEGRVSDTKVHLDDTSKSCENLPQTARVLDTGAHVEGEELRMALGRRNSIVTGLTLERRASASDQLRDKLRTKFLTHVRKSLLTGGDVRSVNCLEDENEGNVSTASSSLLTGRQLLRPKESGSRGLQASSSSSTDTSVIPGSQLLLQSLNVTPVRSGDRRRSDRLLQPRRDAEDTVVTGAPQRLDGGEVGKSPVIGCTSNTVGRRAETATNIVNTAPETSKTTLPAAAAASDGGFTSDDDDYSTPLATRMYNKFLTRKPPGQEMFALASPINTRTPAIEGDTLVGENSSGSSAEKVSLSTINLHKLFNEKYARRGSRLSTAFDDTVMLPNSLVKPKVIPAKGTPGCKSTFNDTFVLNNQQAANCHVGGVLESTRNEKESTMFESSTFADGSHNALSSIQAFPCRIDQSGSDTSGAAGDRNNRRRSRRISSLLGAGLGGRHASDGDVFLSNDSQTLGEGSSCAIVDVPAKNISDIDALLYSSITATHRLDGNALSGVNKSRETSTSTIPATSVAPTNVSSCSTQSKGKKRRPLLKSDAFDAAHEDLIVPLTPPIDNDGLTARTHAADFYDVLRTNSLNKKGKSQRSAIKTSHVTGQEPMPLPRTVKRKVLASDAGTENNRKRRSLTTVEESGGNDDNFSSTTEGEASPVEKIIRATNRPKSVRIVEPGSSTAKIQSYDDSYEAFDINKRGRGISDSSKKIPKNIIKSRRISTSHCNKTKKSPIKPPGTPLKPATGTCNKITPIEGPSSRSRSRGGTTQQSVSARRRSSIGRSRSGSSVESRGGASRGRRQKKCSRSLLLDESLPGICLTSVHSSEVEVLYPIIESLGGFNIRTRANSSTTHLVSGQGARRTVNMLLACLHGASLVTTDWVYSSLQQERWVDVAPFAVPDFSPTAEAVAALKARGCPVQLLASVGPVFVSSNSAPPRADLLELLSLAGGKAAQSFAAASVVLWPQTAPVTAALEEQLLRYAQETISGTEKLPFREEEEDDGTGEHPNTNQPRLDGQILERIIASSKFTSEDESDDVVGNNTGHWDDTVLLAGNEDNGDTKLDGGPDPCNTGKQKRISGGLAALKAVGGDTRAQGLLAGSSVSAPLRSYSSMSVDYPPGVSRSRMLFATPNREDGGSIRSNGSADRTKNRSRLSSVREDLEEEGAKRGGAEGESSSNTVGKSIKGVTVVHEKWFLDTVQYFRVQPFENYLIPHVEEARKRVQQLGRTGGRVTFDESSGKEERMGQGRKSDRGRAAVAESTQSCSESGAARDRKTTIGRRRSTRVSLPAR